MEITRTTREAAFTACWNQRVKVHQRLKRQLKKGGCNTFETKRQIAELDKAVDELRY